MIGVSQEWQNSIQEQFRYQGFLKVTINVTPPGIREKVTASTYPAVSTLSNVQSMFNGEMARISPVATLEPNRWRGDGSMYLASSDKADNLNIGMWSEDVKPPGVTFVILFNFDKLYSIPGVYAMWDTESNSWPTNITLEGMNNAGVVTQKFNITSMSKDEEFIAAPFTDIRYLRMGIHTWSKPQFRVRIAQFMFGMFAVIDDNRLISANSSSKISLMGEGLPTHEQRITARNYDQYFDPQLKKGVSPFLSSRQAVTWQWGFEVSRGSIEYGPPQAVFLDKSDIPQDDPRFTVMFTNRLSLLSEVYRKGKYTAVSRTMYDVALDVLTNTNVLKVTAGETPWVLPETLKNISTIAPTPAMRANEILNYVANATGHTLMIDPTNGYIQFVPEPFDTGRQITRNQILGETGVEIMDKLRSVSIGIYQYTFDTTITTAYEATLAFTGFKTLNVTYNSDTVYKDLTLTVTGGTVSSSILNSMGAILKITGNGNVVIKITGKAIQSNVTYIEYYLDSTISSGIDVRVDNPLITNTQNAGILADVIIWYYGKRQRYSVPYIVYPEMACMDRLQLNSTYANTPAIVLEHDIDFNGGWSGDMIVLAEEG